MKPIVLILAVTMVLADLCSSVAAADPINSKKAEFVTVTCTNGQELTVVASDGNAGHIVGATWSNIPIEITVTPVDPATGEVRYSETKPVGQSEKVGLHDDLISCSTEPVTYFVPLLGQEATVEGTLEGFLTPLGR